MEKMKFNTNKMCIIALGVALYVVLSFAVKIPLIGHIQTDFGYVAFGAFCVLYGPIATIVGVVGCIIESCLFYGWFPSGWALGQLAIGIMCGLLFNVLHKKIENRYVRAFAECIIAIIMLFVGIVIIKTFVECKLYAIPYEVKIVKDLVAFAADTPPMIIGIILGERFKKEKNDDVM